MTDDQEKEADAIRDAVDRAWLKSVEILPMTDTADVEGLVKRLEGKAKVYAMCNLKADAELFTEAAAARKQEGVEEAEEQVRRPVIRASHE